MGGGGKERGKSMIISVLLLDTKIWYRNRFLKFGNVIHNPWATVCPAVILSVSPGACVRFVSCTVAFRLQVTTSSTNTYASWRLSVCLSPVKVACCFRISILLLEVSSKMNRRNRIAQLIGIFQNLYFRSLLQSPAWCRDTSSLSAALEIPNVSWNPKFLTTFIAALHP